MKRLKCAQEEWIRQAARRALHTPHVFALPHSLTHVTKERPFAKWPLSDVRDGGVVIRAVGERFLFPTVGPSLCMIFINAGRQRRKEHRPRPDLLSPEAHDVNPTFPALFSLPLDDSAFVATSMFIR